MDLQQAFISSRYNTPLCYARHEIGHAVIATYFGTKWDWVSIDPVKLTSPEARGAIAICDKANDVYVLQLITGLLGGWAADIEFGVPRALATASARIDLMILTELITETVGMAKEEEFVGGARANARVIIREFRPQISRLALRLASEKTLYASDFEAELTSEVRAPLDEVFACAKPLTPASNIW
jgi:hypothetical protein